MPTTPKLHTQPDQVSEVTYQSWKQTPKVVEKHIVLSKAKQNDDQSEVKMGSAESKNSNLMKLKQRLEKNREKRQAENMQAVNN